MYFFYKNHSNDAENTLKYHELWTQFKDSISDIESKKFQEEMETKYESEKKDKEIKLQKAANEQQQLITLAILIGGLLIIITVSYGLWTNNKKKKIVEAKNREL